jgi:serine/threonine protein phosphatase PrpC
MFQIISAGLSDIGRKRRSNQDCFLLDDQHRLYLVADGMGGHQAGEVASQLVVDAIHKFYMSNASAPVYTRNEPHDPALSSEANRLRAAIDYANLQVYQASTTHKHYKGMGSTLAVVHFSGNMFIAANVGDSPIYLIHDDAIEMLSVPHTLMAEQSELDPVDRSVFGPELQHMLTRGMGVENTVSPDIWESPCFIGDLLVICSDGLSGKLTPEEIRELTSRQNADAACRSMVELANQRGGEDNITVIVLQVCKPNRVLQRLRDGMARFTGGKLSKA